MYAIASTKFYAALGIYDVPTYVIITEGPVAVVTVTYGERWDDHPFDVDRYQPQTLVPKVFGFVAKFSQWLIMCYSQLRSM